MAVAVLLLLGHKENKAAAAGGKKKKKKEELHSSKAGKGLSRPDQNRLGYPQHGETESTPQLCHLPATASGYIIYLLV